MARGTGSGGSNTGNMGDLLRAIRRQIEREHAKTYSDIARRDGLHGTVEVRFRVAADGSAETVEVVRSSGHTHLDEVSTRTVRRAGPYPPFEGWIQIPLSYRLESSP